LTCLFCEQDVLWERELMPVDAYVAEEAGWNDVDEDDAA